MLYEITHFDITTPSVPQAGQEPGNSAEEPGIRPDQVLLKTTLVTGRGPSSRPVTRANCQRRRMSASRSAHVVHFTTAFYTPPQFLPWSGTSGRAVGSGTAGRTPATDEASSSPDSQHPQHPSFAQPKRPAARTANIYDAQVLHSRSVQQLEQPTSTVSRFRKAEASRNYNIQHLQCPGFAKLRHPGTTTPNIYDAQVLNSPSIQQLQQPTSTMPKFRKAEASRNYNSQHLQHPSFAQQLSSATETLGT